MALGLSERLTGDLGEFLMFSLCEQALTIVTKGNTVLQEKAPAQSIKTQILEQFSQFLIVFKTLGLEKSTKVILDATV